MSEEKPVAKPFLDWYGVFASHRKIEEDGTIWSQEPPQGVQLRIEPAKKSDPFLIPEKPWERGAPPHVITVLQESGVCRLWYGVSNGDDPPRSFVCYAESRDGFVWDRPELGLVEYEGSKKNNIISEGEDHFLGAVFVDPSAPPEERYKAVAPKGSYYREGRLDPDMNKQKYKELRVAMDLGDVTAREKAQRIEIRQALHAAVSPDGLLWRNLDQPILDVGNTALDTHNLCTFDPYEGKYVAYLRGHLERRRLVRRAEGKDFRHLEAPRPCLMTDPQDPLDDDIYNPCYSPYPGRRRYLMFPSFYHRIESTVDVQLAVSHDSYIWIRPERRPIIDRVYEGGEYGTLYAYPNLVALDHGEWRLAFAEHQHRHDFRRRGATYPRDGELRWACWQEDRLAGLEAPDEGRVTLVERECQGREMRLNYRTAPDGWVQAELVHPPQTPPEEVRAFPGFSREEAEKLRGDELARVVTWKGKQDLSSLKGQKVAVRLHLYKAKIFSTAL